MPLITKIEIQKKKPNRRSVYIDGKYAFGIDEEVLLQFNLEEDQTIDEQEIKDIQKAEEKRACKESSLRLLSYRMRTENELRKRLKQKNYNQEVIDEVLDSLKRLDLINDLEFARMWMRERGSWRGKFKLKTELWEKGVSQEIIETVLSELPLNESEIAERLADKWLKSHKNLGDDVSKRRLTNFLLRRGISYDTISELRIEH